MHKNYFSANVLYNVAVSIAVLSDPDVRLNSTRMEYYVDLDAVF